MTNYDKLKKDTSFHEFAQWLDLYGNFEGAPWMIWFNKMYCDQCPSTTVSYTYKNGEKHECPCAWCEVHDGCIYFPERTSKEPPSSLEIIELWLCAEAEENENLLL